MNGALIVSLGIHGLLLLAVVLGASPHRIYEASNPIAVEIELVSGLIETAEDLQGEQDSTEAEAADELSAEEQPVVEAPSEQPPAAQLPAEDSPFQEQLDSITVADDLTLVEEVVETATRVGESKPLDAARPSPALALLEDLAETAAPMSLEGEDSTENALAASQSRAASGAEDGNPDVSSNEPDASTTTPSAVESDAPALGYALDVGDAPLPAPGLKPYDADDLLALLSEEATDQSTDAEKRKGAEAPIKREQPTPEEAGPDDVNFEGSESEAAEKFVLPIKPKRKPRALVAQAKEQLKREAEAKQRAEEQRIAEAKAAKQQAEEAEALKRAEQEIVKAEQERWDREETERLRAEQAAAQEAESTDSELENILADLDLAARNQPVTTAPQGATARSQLTNSEISAIQSDIANAWRVPPGVTVETAPVVRVKVELAPDGSVLGVVVVDQTRYRSDPVFRAAADSMTRSVWQASPLAVPEATYETWRFMTLTYDLKDLL